MKKIGFIDYYLSEWHANHYPAWIEAANQALGTDYKVAYAWAELDVSPKDGKTTREWCEAYGAEPCETLTELCEKSDALLILAPSDPDKHLPYAETALKYGKPTYIDKTFAPDFATAKRIFALGEAYHTPFFSTSALRYATETDICGDCRHITVTGSGRSAEEYIVHQAEMVVKALGTGAKNIRAEQAGDTTVFRIGYNDDRSAVMTFSPAHPFSVYRSGGAEAPKWSKISSDFFAALLCDILRFFESGAPSFDPLQTLEVIKLREGALKAAQAPDTWVSL